MKDTYMNPKYTGSKVKATDSRTSLVHKIFY